MVITGIISAAMLASTAASTWAADKSDKDVLRVGMECAYAPFNWTQDTDTTPDGSKAEPIYGSDYYAYGYDVAVAQKLADQLGMKLEIHKVSGPPLESPWMPAIMTVSSLAWEKRQKEKNHMHLQNHIITEITVSW